MLVTATASILMVAGWYACRTRIREIAQTREGHTGLSPVVANPPAATFKK
jgi:L-asparagine permease